MNPQERGILSDTAIKVFGERNCATRAVIQMIDAAEGLCGAGHPGVPQKQLKKYVDMEEALEGVFSNPWLKIYREAIRDQKNAASGPIGVWKHTAPAFHADFKRHDVRVLFLVRNPYSWALSLYQRPYHHLGPRRKTFEEFLNVPWMTLGRDNLEKVLTSPVLLWTLKLQAYQRFMMDARNSETPYAVLNFEDFVIDPVAALTEATEVISGAVFKFQPLGESTKADGVKDAERKAYYGNEQWRAKLTAGAVRLINTHIDWTIATEYGYARLNPRDFPAKLD